MTQIKIEVPSNDPIALSALGEALQRIAAERHEQDVFSGLVSKAEEGYSSREDVERAEAKLERNATCGAHTDPYVNVELKDDVTKREGDLVTSSDVKVCETTSDFVNACVGDLTEQVNMTQNIMEEELKHVDDTLEQYEAGGGVEDDTLDADGLPWDKRIHSRGKTRLADDTWRLARKPNDKTQEEWDEYVASVKAELKAVQDIPAPSDTVTPPVVDEDDAASVEDITQAEVDAGNLTPPVVETETVTPPTLDEQAVADVQASEPVAAVEPPASVTAPVVTDNTAMPTTFQELMKYITSDAAKRGATNDMIKEVLAQVDPSLTAIPLIANRADLIPTFVAKLEGRLS